MRDVFGRWLWKYYDAIGRPIFSTKLRLKEFICCRLKKLRRTIFHLGYMAVDC